MKIKNKAFLFFAASLIALSCSFAQSLVETLTPPPAATVLPPPTLTSSPLPTSAPVMSDYVPVPRWMILGQPGYNIEILGETWNYADDNWGEAYGCIDYTRETGTYVFFEQCFAVTQENLTFETQRDVFLKKGGFDALVPGNTFGNAGQISLLGKRVEDNEKKYIKFFELLGVDNYILFVEMNIATTEDAPLQKIYEAQAADILDYILQNSLEKSRLIARPTATPLSPNQQKFYDDLSVKLVNDTEASSLYLAALMGETVGSVDGTWEALGDRVQDDQTRVCRLFEDRTNIDARWVKFQNCISAAKEFPFEKIASRYNQPGDTVLMSSHQFENDFVVYGYNDGHTFFDAYLLDGEFIYQVSINSRTMTGEKIEEVFSQTMDDFIYNVLMINAKR